jgi:hypothetical protein
MTLFQIIQILKEIALAQPNIKSATDGSIYDIMNTNPSVKYDVVHFSQTTHQSDEETDYYGLNIFYVSRLEDSLEDNRLQIQSIGKEVLDNIIRTFCENWGIDFPIITYTPFTQKFNDLCAGCYCNLRLEIPKEIICADDYVAEVVPGSGIKLQDIGITITQNGLIVVTPDAEYDGIGEIRIETNVPQSAAVLQDKEVEYTENGSYNIHPDLGYDGLSSVSVDVDVPDNYDEGYDDGKQDGENEQKAKLTVTSFTENNTYTRENGWSAVTVDVPSDYQDGYDDGVADQKAKMVATAITENGEYGRPDGYSAITVNVPAGDDRYEEGFNDGMQYQKDKMVVTSVTENGLYMREDGYAAFYVEVPQTGSSNEDLIANLQGDYYLIPYGTTHLRDYAFYATCFSSITIPTTVSAIGRDSFAVNICLTSITIPDSVQYLGTYVFQGDGALETVIIGSGISEIQNRTFSGCRALTGITIPSGVTSIGNSVFDGCSALTEMTFEGLTPPTLGNTGNSLGSTAYTFPIYVPCQSLDAYKTAFGEAYAPRIQCKEEPQPTGDTAITAITLVVDSAITDSGTATTEYSPIDAPTDIYYTSSDPSIATVDSGTGVITVIADGTVTICVNDRISGLQDCKTITVDLSDLSALGMAIYDVKTTSSRTEILGPEGYKSFDYMIYNGKRINIIDGATGYTFSATGRQVVYYHFRDPQTLKKATFWRGKNNWNDPLPLVAFTMPQTVRKIEEYSFRCTALEYFTLPKSVTAITMGGQQFYGCKKLSGFTFETGSTIGSFTPGLYDTHITTLSIPDNVNEIGYMRMNTYLTSVTIGTGITKIMSSTFANCSALTTVTIYKTTPPTLGNSAFAYTALQNIYVPSSAVNAYKTAWPEYADKIQAIA